MVIDCGDDTVNLKIIQLLADEKLIIISERIGNDCGRNFVNQEFLKFLERKVGSSAINRLRKNQSDQFQNMIQFFQMIDFTGIQSDYPIEFDLEGNIFKKIF